MKTFMSFIYYICLNVNFLTNFSCGQNSGPPSPPSTKTSWCQCYFISQVFVSITNLAKIHQRCVRRSSCCTAARNKPCTASTKVFFGFAVMALSSRTGEASEIKEEKTFSVTKNSKHTEDCCTSTAYLVLYCRKTPTLPPHDSKSSHQIFQHRTEEQLL